MQPASKFFLKSLTVWGVFLGIVTSYVQQHYHVNLDDQVQSTTQAVSQIVVGVIHLGAVIMVIVGRFRAAQPLHVLAPPPGAATSPTVKGVTAFALVTFLGCGLCTTACTSAQEQSALTAAESLAWTTANAFETANTGGVLTNALLNSALVATHNTSDEAVVDALGTAGNAVIAPVIAKQAAAVQAKLATDVTTATAAAASQPGATTATVQAAATAVLSNPAEIAAAAAQAPALNAVTAGSGSTVDPAAPVPVNP